MGGAELLRGAQRVGVKLSRRARRVAGWARGGSQLSPTRRAPRNSSAPPIARPAIPPPHPSRHPRQLPPTPCAPRDNCLPPVSPPRQHPPQGSNRRGGGFGRTPPPPSVPLWSPPKGDRKILKRKSSWHRRRRSKILAVSLKHCKRRREGGRGSKGREVGGGQGRYPPSSYGVRPFYYITAPHPPVTPPATAPPTRCAPRDSSPPPVVVRNFANAHHTSGGCRSSCGCLCGMYSSMFLELNRCLHLLNSSPA